MKQFKKVYIFTLISMFLLSGIAFSVAAKNDNNAAESDIPEIDGVYNVPGHPDMKVRVFVHKAKPGGGGSTPICGLTDPDSEAVVGDAGWRLPGAITYRLNQTSAPVGLQSQAANIVAASFSAWTSATDKVIINRGDDTTVAVKRLDGQNIITWGRTSGSALGVTYVWYNTVTKVINEVDTIMNNKFTWSWTPYANPGCSVQNTYDAQNIMTHELGHWFGLDDHYDSAYINSTMYGFGSKAEIKKDTLTAGDIAGLVLLYQ